MADYGLKAFKVCILPVDISSMVCNKRRLEENTSAITELQGHDGESVAFVPPNRPFFVCSRSRTVIIIINSSLHDLLEYPMLPAS